MNFTLLLDNLFSWSSQVFVLALFGAMLPRLLRLRHPASQLAFNHLVLITCLLLPLVQPWHTKSVMFRDSRSALPFTRQLPLVSVPTSQEWNWQEIIAAILLAGFAIRCSTIAVGLLRLRRYRQQAVPLVICPNSITVAENLTQTAALFFISKTIPGPATFGAHHPVILLPQSFLALSEAEQTCIACHELLHVRRLDWLVNLTEEITGALFWFNPAIWWLLAQAKLLREQVVDQKVVQLTESKDSYIDALMAMAGATPSFYLNTAPMFLRNKHLAARMHLLVKEIEMSKCRLITSYVSMATFLTFVAWSAFNTFPLNAAQLSTAKYPVHLSSSEVSFSAIIETIEFKNVSAEEQKLVLDRTGVRVGQPLSIETRHRIGSELSKINKRMTFTYKSGVRLGTARLIINGGC